MVTRIEKTIYNQVYALISNNEGSGSVGNVWDGANAHQQAVTRRDINPKEVAMDLSKAIANKDFDMFKLLINTVNSNQLEYVMNEYRLASGGLSIMDAIKTTFSDKPVEQLDKALRNFDKGSYAHIEVLAYDLMQALNQNDLETIESLMKNVENLSPKGVKDLYTIYQHRSIAINKMKEKYADKEVAATAEEKKMLDGPFFFFNHKKIKRNASRPETFLQGILNNSELTLEKQKEYVQLISDKHVEFAKETGIPEVKINDYIEKAKMHIKDMTSRDNAIVNNAYFLEEDLAELFGYKK